MAAVRKEKRREKKKVFLKKEKEKQSGFVSGLPPSFPLFVLSHFSFLFVFLQFLDNLRARRRSSSCQSSCLKYKQKCRLLMPFHPANKAPVPFNRAIWEENNGDRNIIHVRSLNSDIDWSYFIRKTVTLLSDALLSLSWKDLKIFPLLMADGNSLAHMPCPQCPIRDVDQCVSQSSG